MLSCTKIIQRGFILLAYVAMKFCIDLIKHMFVYTVLAFRIQRTSQGKAKKDVSGIIMLMSKRILGGHRGKFTLQPGPQNSNCAAILQMNI